jgi:tryptophan synthase alpha chain
MTGIERIAAVFARAKREARCVLIPYLMAGDPDRETTATMLSALASAGADLIELGVPYGDPLADGPTIAAAAQRALAGGMTLDGALALARATASANEPPIVLFTYVNPIAQYGLERFAEALVAAGAAGAIVPDMPLEESGAIRDVFSARGLALPLLVAPTTPLERAVAIAGASDGFVYLVSRLGVTSAGKEPDLAWIASRVTELRARTERPIAVGFGVSTPEHVRQIGEHADGAIIGSALIDACAGLHGEAAAARAAAFLTSLRGEGSRRGQSER